MKQKKLSRGIRFLLWLITFVLSIALMASVTIAALVADVRTVTSKDNIREFIHQLIAEPAQVHGKTPLQQGTGGVRNAAPSLRVHNLPRRDDVSGLASNLTDLLIDMLYEQLSEHFEGELTVSQEELENIIDNSTVKDFVVDKTASLISDYFLGEITTTFEADEIIQLIEENEDQIEELIGEPIPEEVKEQVAEIFESNEIIQKVEQEGLAGFMEATGTEIPGLPVQPESENALGEALAKMFGMPGIADMVADIARDLSNGQLNGISGINDIMVIFRTNTSQEVLTRWILISIALIIAIILVNIMQLPTGLRRAGYPLILSGLMIIPCLLAQFAPDLFALPGLNILQRILIMILPVYAVIFGTGLALVIAGIVLGIIFKRKRKAVVAPAPVYAAPTPAYKPAPTPAAAPLYAAPKTTPAPVPAPVVETPVEATVEEVPVETTVEEAPVEPAAEEIVEEVAKEAVAEEIVEEAGEELTVEPLPEVAPMEELTTEEAPVEETAEEVPDEEETKTEEAPAPVGE